VGESKWGKALFGAVIGAVLGVFLGIHRVSESLVEEGKGGVTTVDFSFVVHSPRFWIVLVICTLAFAFIAGRIGRPASQADL
jgi:ABC-type antimicrobial peptide transport system permease subunit